MNEIKFDPPKITIVTACLNQADYINTTIQSVLNQEYPNLEYIICDGGSTDGTIDVIRSYSKKISYWISEKDSGQYNAINKGFQHSSGQIMAWLNADDVLHPKSLWTVAQIFNDFPEIKWLHGNPTWIDSMGRTVMVKSPPRWSRMRLLKKDFQWLQQESIFWSRDLWEASGGRLDENYQLAADFELWVRFFERENLFTTTAPVAGFRSRPYQRSSIFREEYLIEVQTILKKCFRHQKNQKTYKNSK
ncbi:MAG: glycosyltransferase family 2 protein [Anaerolineaceae bacterium]|jgi:glycosyltransferase involved in cell wall biosynthesis